VDHFIEEFRLGIREIRTYNDYEFQPKFHWHIEDLVISHAHIKRGTPQLNGKVERSHPSDQQESYQLLPQKHDIDFEGKLNEWENFYNYNRPNGAFNGKTPYEAVRSGL
jgi:transposase InsO family protein